MYVHMPGYFLKLFSRSEGSNTALPSSKQDAGQPSLHNLTLGVHIINAYLEN